MTPAIKLLEKQKLPFDVLTYQHDSNCNQFGLEAVEKLNLNAELVYKTLVLETSEQQLIVAITPVTKQVNLKLLAKACSVKKVAMATPNRVESMTGYILGGVSPIAQKKRLTTFLHISAKQFKSIFVSAGKRGVEIELTPKDLLTLTKGRYAEF